MLSVWGPPCPVGLCPGQAALHWNIHCEHHILGAVVCNRVPNEHKCCWHQQIQFTQKRLLSGYGPIPPQVLTRFVFSALDDAAFLGASKSSSAMSSQRERELCSSLGSLLPVFQFADVRLRGGRGGEVQSQASSRWVGACSSTRRDGRHRRHSRNLRQGAQQKLRCGDNKLVLVVVCWFRDSRGPERGECKIEKTATAIKSSPSPTRDAANGGAAACARRREPENSPGLNPEAGHNPR